MKTLQEHWRSLISILAAGTLAVLATVTVIATPQPVLTITSLGTNQFQIGITNGVTNEVYVLYWTPLLANPAYPWEVITIGSLGQTNFTVDASVWLNGFFRIAFGTDWDNDGVVNWVDGNATDPSIGALTVTIDSPLSGETLQ